MFKKHFRLNTSDFNEVFSLGKNSRNNLFGIKYKENNLKHPRFAVVVSKKIAKKAVERNYLKRRFYSALKQSVEIFPVADYIFILNSAVKDIQYKDLLLNIKNTKINL